MNSLEHQPLQLPVLWSPEFYNPLAIIHITQLIYIKEGQEEVLHQFEDIAIPIIIKYNGRLLLRVSPNEDSFIEYHIDQPYEIHIVEFDSEQGLKKISDKIKNDYTFYT